MASQKVENLINCDNNLKSTASLSSACQSRPTISGLEDLDYPTTLEHPSCRIPLTSGLTTVPLPIQLVEQFINVRTNCEMGLFTEIGRAWLSIDSVVYIWSYSSSSGCNDVAYYNDLEQTIIGVCLIKPKANIFKTHIKYLLCLTTSSQIVCLGVTFGSESSDENPPIVLLIPDPLFKLSTDDVILTTIAGTRDGRIFLGGQDGCLYEITYQAEEGWFSKKANKINHSSNKLSYVLPTFLNFSESEPIVQIEIDDSRKILFTRSEKGSIRVYDFEHEKVSLVISKPLASIVNRAASIATTIDLENLRPIVSIKTISAQESAELNLIAITHTGVRLYFNCGRDRPTGLDLVHIRLPPGFTPSSSGSGGSNSSGSALIKPHFVNNVYCKNNTFIMTSSSTNCADKDFLWFLSGEGQVGQIQDKLMEMFSVTPLSGRVWRIAEEISNNPVMSRFSSCVLKPNLTQHLEEKKKFVLLTSQGIHIVYKLRPIDQLSSLLLDNHGPESPAVKQFFGNNTPTEVCLTALILACTAKLPAEGQLAEWATLAFFRYGGEPLIIQANPQQNVSQSVVFSARHDAVYLYLSRTLRPIWSINFCCRSFKSPIQTGRNKSIGLKNTANIDEINVYLKRLMELKQFLQNNVQLTLTSNSALNLNQLQGQKDLASNEERESLSSLIQLLNRCIEVLQLYKLICEHNFQTVTSDLPPDVQNQLSTMTFRDLIINGVEVTTTLAGALVRTYLNDNRSTDAISHRLHDLCPSIYRQENALHAKAHEILLKSRLITDPLEIDRKITEALTLFKSIGGRIDLISACDLLYSVKAYKSIVDLCLYIAEKRDPQNLASYYRKNVVNGATSSEQGDSAQAARDRMDCYLRIIDTLDRLMNSSRSYIPSPTLESSRDGISHSNTSLDDELSERDEAKIAFDQVLKASVRSKDEMFHMKLYEWLCQNNLSSKLLDIQSPFLKEFLTQKSTGNDSIKYLDLLWMYYERHGAFSQAAQILNRLASRHTNEYDLHKRMEYLSRATICMQSCSSHSLVANADDLHSPKHSTQGEFLHELEERMEVARIQLTIFNRIKELPDHSVTQQEALASLNRELLEVTPLYGEFAEKFGLYDCQLAILKCAGHHDPTLIESLWKNIIDELVAKFVTGHDGNQDTQIALMSHEFKNLVSQFMPSERYFPALFIVGYLEFKTHHLNNTRWVFQALLDVGYSFVTILNTYHKYYKLRDQSTSWPKKAIHVLTIIATMMETFLGNNIATVAPSERSVIASKCLDVLCGYIIDLQTMGSSDSQVRELLDRFRIIQAGIGHFVRN